MHLFHLPILSLIALGIANKFICLEASHSNNNDWQEQYNSIYKTHERSLEPKETLKLLEELSKKFQGATDEELILTRKNIQELIDVSQVDSGKCLNYYRNYELTVNLIEANKDHPNVIALLRDSQRRLFTTCRGRLRGRLNGMLQDISEDIKDKLVVLRESVRESTEGRSSELFREAYERDLVKASLIFMEKITGQLVSKFLHQPDGRKEYALEFREKFRKPCLVVVLKIFPAIREYNLMSFEREILNLFDPFEVEWLENYNVCSMMMEHGATSANELMEKSYDLLVGNSPRIETRDEGRDFKVGAGKRKSFWKNCAGCLGF